MYMYMYIYIYIYIYTYTHTYEDMCIYIVMYMLIINRSTVVSTCIRPASSG